MGTSPRRWRLRHTVAGSQCMLLPAPRRPRPLPRAFAPYPPAAAPSVHTIYAEEERNACCHFTPDATPEYL